jgi:capsular polysaccharide biosynthesis protein
MTHVGEIRFIGAPPRAGTRAAASYRSVADAACVPVRPPPFVLGPAPAALLWDMFADIGAPAAGLYEIEDVTVAPTGIPIRDGVAFYGEQFMQPECHVEHLAARLNREDLPIRHVPGPLAVMCGPAHETWGHWLTDLLPCLWLLRAAGHDLSALRFLVPWDLRAFAAALLVLCGIRAEQCVVYQYWQEIIRTDRLLLPTFMRAGNRFATCFADATAWWVARARTAAGITAGGPGRLMLSRGNAPKQRVMENRAAIEAAAIDAGYTVVRPEEKTIPDQIALFAGARIIVGEYGSALHNSVFAPPGTLVCGLRGTSRHPSLVQTGIATALGQDAAYVLGDTGGQDIVQRFSIEPRLFTRALRMLDALDQQRPAGAAIGCAPAKSDSATARPRKSPARSAPPAPR